MINGIDVSSYQSETYSTSGLSFVFVKRTEGEGYVNPKASAQVAHGRANGLVVGHYCYPHIADSGAADADYFLNHLGSDLHSGDVLALDWEWYGQAAVSAAEADAFKDAWIARVRAKTSGHRIVTYADRSNWLNVDKNSNVGDGLWIADYVTAGKPRIKAKWLFHQFSSSPIDQDVANFPSREALAAWALAQPAPKPTPSPTATYTEDDMLSYLTIASGIDVDIPVEPAGTLAKPQGGVKNGPMWLGLAAQGADASVAVTFHTAKGWGKPTTSTLKHGGGKHMIALPGDGSVDTIRVHSTGAPLIGYIVGRQVA
ncbi:hypothetical protein GTY41_03845 [Streptomyces sp. SID685]|uniref:GH25 family lysozyme n=1 Tax=Streptomyces sp. SID685 TaxID=2690322 RepID=UPI0013697C3A|nr:hypothetical protein [Streptomyces sp. SID685]